MTATASAPHSVVVRTAGDGGRGPRAVVTERLRRIEVFERVQQLRAEQPAAPIDLIVSASPGGALADDFARIRWFAHVYRDLRCRVTYAIVLRHGSDPRPLALGALAAGAATIEIDVDRSEPAGGEEVAAAVRDIEALVREYSAPPPASQAAAVADVRRASTGERVAVLISARLASARLPRKAFAEIAGVRSIALLIERLKQSKTCAPIVLCTTTASDDDELAAAAEQQGIDVYRGANEHVARRLAGAVRQFGLDHFVRITGDNPLCAVDLLDRAVETHVRSGADYTSMAPVFVGGASEVVSARAITAIADRAVVGGNTEYLTWYLDDPSVFHTQRLAADADYWRDYRLTLDTPQDLAVIRAVYDALYKPGRPVDARAALRWLDAHPEVARTNVTVAPKLARTNLNLDLYL